MRILITGGTGFIGQHFIRSRLDKGDEIYCYSRSAAKVEQLFGGRVVAVTQMPPPPDLSVDAVVNLAGEPIADKRWSDARKQLLRESRINLTDTLVEWIAALPEKPEVLISGSAIGYYGSVEGDQLLAENADVSQGFTHALCRDWENSALKAEEAGVRVCLIRTGVVLGQGGALAKMLPPFKMGLGGPIGKGEQWMSWIHIDDEVAIIETLLSDQQLRGAFNLTAPKAATNKEFSTALGRALNRPAFLPVPPFVIKLMLGEGAELLLEGQRVYPARLMDSGYEFKFPQLDQALADIVR
jgi:uncharacterized protein (TIGR01777 family)